MKKIEKNIIVIICAGLMVVLLLLAAFFQDSLIHIVTHVWGALSEEVKVEESLTKANGENELNLEESVIEQEEYIESLPQVEESETKSENSNNSVEEMDSNIQIFPEEESKEPAEEESDFIEESAVNESQVPEESDETHSQVPEESESQNENLKLTEFPITPF